MKVELVNRFNPGDDAIDIQNEYFPKEVKIIDIEWHESVRDFFYLVEYPDRTRRWIGELSDYLCKK